MILIKKITYSIGGVKTEYAKAKSLDTHLNSLEYNDNPPFPFENLIDTSFDQIDFGKTPYYYREMNSDEIEKYKEYIKFLDELCQ